MMNSIDQYLNNLIAGLIADDEKVDGLLADIDRAARDVCGIEYGLPLHGDFEKERFRKIVIAWILSLRQEETQ